MLYRKKPVRSKLPYIPKKKVRSAGEACEGCGKELREYELIHGCFNCAKLKKEKLIR